MSVNQRISGCLLPACLLSFLFLLNAAAALSQHPVRFAVLGDRSSGHVPGVYGQIVREIERLKPDFVMTVGDMIEGDIEDSLTIEQLWDDYLKLVEPLSMPIHYVPGNNDIWSDLSERLYREHAGKPFYSFDHGPLHFVMLDNSRIEGSEEFPNDQIEWLEADLKNSGDAQYTIAFFHKPFWNESVVLGEPDILHDLFVEYDVDAVFSGHYHQYFSGLYDGVIYTNIGSSGGGTTPSPSGLEYHFAWVTVDANGIHIAPIHMGSILPWDILSAEERKLCQRLEREGLYFKERLAVDETRQLVDTQAVLVVDNTFSSLPLTQEIVWSIPEGWAVTPDRATIKLPSGVEKTYRFHVACTGMLFPVPEASVEFSYAENKSTPISAPLKLTRSVIARQALSPVTIDGRIAEPVWSDPATVLYHPQGGGSTIDPVKFYFAYDSGNLYLAADCRDEEIDSLTARSTDHDGPVYQEDCVGYFIEPASEEGSIYQIYINPLGAVFDQRIWLDGDGYPHSDREWDGSYEVKASVGESGWIVEARIPLEQWNVKAEEGGHWRLNFRRKQARFNSAADWQVPIDYNPDTFGTLALK